MLKRELVRGIVISNTCVKLYRNWIINEVARAGEHTNERTYVLTYIRTGQTLYPPHNFVVRGDNEGYKACFFFLFFFIDNQQKIPELPKTNPLAAIFTGETNARENYFLLLKINLSNWLLLKGRICSLAILSAKGLMA